MTVIKTNDLIAFDRPYLTRQVNRMRKWCILYEMSGCTCATICYFDI